MPQEAKSITRIPTKVKQTLALLAQIGGVTILVFLATRFYSDISSQRLIEDNLRLRNLLTQADSRLNLLETMVDSLQMSDHHLRQLANLEPIPEDVRRMGVGGTIYEGWPLLYDDVDLRSLNQIERETQLLGRSLEEVGSALTQHLEEIAHIPTVRPVREGFISSGYGYRPDPFSGRRRMHRGLDFQAPVGTPVLAPADGRVTQANRVSGFGRVIKMDHGNGIVTVYAHLSRFSVRVGQQVKRGEQIGSVGNSGRSTGPHLHYEVHVDGRHINPQNFIHDEYAILD